MAQLNVAREPSMDEILASIRKIIENNEPGPTGASGRQAFEDEAEDEIELTIDSEIEAAAFSRSETRISPSTPSSDAANGGNAPVPETPPPAPLSLADVAARVRAASERHAVSYASKDEPGMEGAEPVRPVKDSPMITSRMAAISSPMTTETSATLSNGAPLHHVAADPAQAESEPPISFQSAVGEETAESEQGADAIVSPAVSRQVARAFDDLAHAVEQGPRRSFDEIAEAMLRPMLQEWLDDNLPKLVERLVREEIERVARGPRR
ncbi:PopZ family protein [Sinorhizobium numidicum]|uniref:PopZ family protein n=1 Tax=Sinorhizobium numidicum TaxID=680248 RepID=A0ABY8CXP4_9HYPH|nr:PopZ family protein [Sinorhizobium numidicum]WEX78835.1 PopZ family protein [Sinorhizobium numidicum]WEX82232.1 PopZ family protein [Sinorhizobium numidicum]